MPAYNEEPNICDAVSSFAALDTVDEVIVVDNNSTDQTAQIARQNGATVVPEPRQGYGYACRRGLDEATDRAELAVLVEPDGTFMTRDVQKLLVYADDCDLVLGTRTSSEFIWDEAKMGPFLRWGNWGLAKLIEVLFNTTNLTDVGCTYRLIDADSYEMIRNSLMVGGSHFSPEMIVRASQNNLEMIQIPVNYQPRQGESKITDNRWAAFKLGLIMTWFILRERLS
ncbi:glycosyltransferase family 2 protein [Halorientalis marina]|uniref:glycosyltransferase family 2 protein n=1 Tax=Halorientalis marina TaxID=2931976 RepID=UPI001FF569D3|nr:glycosyltransferase family 2 protein [Halorientalis marina]